MLAVAYERTQELARDLRAVGCGDLDVEGNHLCCLHILWIICCATITGKGLADEALLLLVIPSTMFPLCIELLLSNTFAMFCDTILVLEMLMGSDIVTFCHDITDPAVSGFVMRCKLE